MAFSYKVKEELVSCINRYEAAELAGFLDVFNMSDKREVYIKTENIFALSRIHKSLLHYNVKFNGTVVNITDHDIVAHILSDTKPYSIRYGALPGYSRSCLRSYIRAIFIVIGYISDPKRSYHLELVFYDSKFKDKVAKAVSIFNINLKAISRKQAYVLYLKESENIINFLNVIGAHSSLMDYQNICILKDIRNNINRVVNCETANISKTILASIKQIEDIETIYNEKGADYLDRALTEVCNVRLKYPDISMKELGNILSPAVSKSGINHRFRKINQIASNIRRGLL